MGKWMLRFLVEYGLPLNDRQQQSAAHEGSSHTTAFSNEHATRMDRTYLAAADLSRLL